MCMAPAMFHGLSAFPITPADPHGHVDTDALVRLVQRLAAAEVDSIGLLGSTGTYAYLTRAERRRAVEAAAGCLVLLCQLALAFPYVGHGESDERGCGPPAW